MCKKSEGRPLTWPQMKHAILRNFGGLESDKLDPFEEFRMRLNMPEMEPRREDYDDSEVLAYYFYYDHRLSMYITLWYRFGVLLIQTAQGLD